MGMKIGSSIVLDGLVLCLDAADFNCINPPVNQLIYHNTTIYDLSEKNNHATSINVVNYDNNNLGSFYFNDINGYISLPANGSYKVQPPLTISCWIKGNGMGNSTETILSTDDWNCNVTGGQSNKYFGTTLDYFYDTNKIAFSNGNGLECGAFGRLTWEVNFSNFNSWHNIVFRNSSINNAQIYINNILQNITLGGAGGGPIIYTSNKTGTIGRRIEAIQNFQGYIAQVLIYNRALSELEIYQNYERTRYRFGI